MSVDPKPVRPSTVGRPGRSSDQIRRDIDAQRQQLGTNGRSAARQGHRSDRLAPPGRGAQTAADHRRRRGRVPGRDQIDALASQEAALARVATAAPIRSRASLDATSPSSPTSLRDSGTRTHAASTIRAPV